jgi:hypothetical protein
MPKVKRNHTMGIKVKWTLESDENWYATHRLAGKVWTVGGLLLMLLAFIPGETMMVVSLIAIIPVTLIPVVYSYLFYRRQLSEGKIEKTKPNKIGIIVTLISVAVLSALFAWIMFTGDIGVDFGEESFTVEASFYSDLTVKYEDIDSIELIDSNVKGTRVGGFGSPRLSMGNFKNEEFGTYTRYTYTNPDSCIVIQVGEKILVISGSDAAETEAIFDTLRQKTGK